MRRPGYRHVVDTTRIPAPRTLPPGGDVLAALYARDASCDGPFLAAMTTTGTFCRPSCPARDPRPEHAESCATAGDAPAAGFRPCRRGRPPEPAGTTPPTVPAPASRGY